MAVGAAQRVHYFVAPHGPIGLVVFGHALLAHDAGYIGRLASPAGSRLVRTCGLGVRSAGTESAGHVLDGVHVSTWGGIIPCECIACPEHYHVGTIGEHIGSFVSVVVHLRHYTFLVGIVDVKRLRIEVRFECLAPSVVLAWEVGAEVLVLCMNLFACEWSLAVVEDAGNFGTSLHQGAGEQPETEDYHHGNDEQCPCFSA